VRKDIKKASELVISAQKILKKTSGSDKIPSGVRDKATHIITLLESSVEELNKMRSYK